MPDFLLELFSEEIPARMQAAMARALEKLVVGALSDRGLYFAGVRTFAGPRRLTLAMSGLPVRQPDVRAERKGPRTDAPQKAIEGFLRAAGVTLEQCREKNDGKGAYYVAVIEHKGEATADVLAQIMPEILRKLPWPKSMRWPQGVDEEIIETDNGLLEGDSGPITGDRIERWVRPLRSILCTFDGEVVPFSFAGVSSGRHTWGHRFLSSEKITVRRFDDYAAALEKAHVVLDAAERKAIIFEGIKQAAFVHGLDMIPDEGLLDEVAGLAEWPVVLTGLIEDRFMTVPPEILQTTMRTNQKYFALRDPKSGKMANRFALVANMVAEDGGKLIVAGNERVLRARLSDAKFFWDQDRARTLESRVEALAGIRFYDEFTMDRKVHGITTKAVEIAEELGVSDEATIEKIRTAGRLCKADLTTGVVGEFPELQGVMGGYYALSNNLDNEIAVAIRDHYKPLGPGDAIPSSFIGSMIALADKLSSLYWLFHEGERPTGSRDPYALRRAALGIVRIILENKYRLKLSYLINLGWLGSLSASVGSGQADTDRAVIEFIIDRLKVALKEKGIRHDLIDAVFSLGNEDDLVRLVARVEALQTFLKTDDGANLLAGYKRAANILKAEEKKGDSFGGAVDAALLRELAEISLAEALTKAKTAIAPALKKEDFAAAMRVMAGLRGPVDAFFEEVKVNADDAKLRVNRLNLLAALRALLHSVADFSKIEN